MKSIQSKPIYLTRTFATLLQTASPLYLLIVQLNTDQLGCTVMVEITLFRCLEVDRLP